MRYVSLCSGVEAASVAWGNLGWEPLAFAEVDPFACAVLAHHYPDVPNLGDICEIDWRDFHEQHGIIDVLIGGTPCQSYSIAGNRLGRKGESGLMSEFIRAARELVEVSQGQSPRYILWENVPGSLSAERGNAFGQLLAELDECGFGLAWRVLDSEFTRVLRRESGRFAGPVPQRRKRVYLIGSLGTDGATEILFERSCLRGNYPKGRKAREVFTSDPAEGAAGGDSAVYCMSSANTRSAIDENVAGTLDAGHEQPIVVGGDVICVADDNAKAAIDENICGSLKIGGSAAWVAYQKPTC